MEKIQAKDSDHDEGEKVRVELASYDFGGDVHNILCRWLRLHSAALQRSIAIAEPAFPLVFDFAARFEIS